MSNIKNVYRKPLLRFTVLGELSAFCQSAPPINSIPDLREDNHTLGWDD